MLQPVVRYLLQNDWTLPQLRKMWSHSWVDLIKSLVFLQTRHGFSSPTQILWTNSSFVVIRFCLSTSYDFLYLLKFRTFSRISLFDIYCQKFQKIPIFGNPGADARKTNYHLFMHFGFSYRFGLKFFRIFKIGPGNEVRQKS